MTSYMSQKGVGMIEILVALLVLAIGVLGFAALQLRAVDATTEAVNRTQAMNLARDLSERIRANRTARDTYRTLIGEGTTAQSSTATRTCLGSTVCTPVEMATYDSAQIIQRANSLAYQIRMPVCQGVQNGRRCIYVAWGTTTATNGTTNNDCTNGTTYVVASRCIVLEAY